MAAGKEVYSKVVSIRASTIGGGTLGDVRALNAHVTVVADLRTDLGLTAFDPRGLFFASDDSLLIANTSAQHSHCRPLLRKGERPGDFRACQGDDRPRRCLSGEENSIQ